MLFKRVIIEEYVNARGIIVGIYKLISISFAILFLVGCSSIEEVVTETNTVASEAFEAGPKGINVEKESFSYFMPDSMEEESSQNHNIILTEGDQTYILFVNSLEQKKSRVVYEASLLDQEYLLNETLEHKDRFGFVQILELEEKSYEVTVGVGGAKLTTVTEKSNVVDSTEKMMKIANSVRFKP
jgi:hypothetical protein